MTHPMARTLDPVAAIVEQSIALADAAGSNLTAPVEFCPGWTVADLVHHLTEVQWFWGTIAAEQLQEPPAEDRRPARPSDEQLISTFREQTRQLAEVLGRAEHSAGVWTWAPSRNDIGFIVRHQVQEAAVHRWDAEHAAGRDVDLDPALAIDSIEEFLTFSVATVSDHPDTPRPGLAGTLVLRATDVDAAWTVADDELPGTVRFERGAGDLPDATIAGTASQLLLWLYGRTTLTAAGPDPAVAGRLRGLSFTD